MARGWESKSVEEQIEAAASRRAVKPPPPPTAEELQVQRERESLEMARSRVMHDLESARNPRYREQLEAALRHLEQRLAGLGDSRGGASV